MLLQKAAPNPALQPTPPKTAPPLMPNVRRRGRGFDRRHVTGYN